MPVQIRKLTSDEAAKVFPKRGQMDLSEYADALRELQPGDAAEIELGQLSSRALKRRLGQAAKQTGYSLKWARDGGTGVLRFQVREARGAQTKARNGPHLPSRLARTTPTASKAESPSPDPPARALPLLDE